MHLHRLSYKEIPPLLTHLLLERVPPLSAGGEVKLLQGNSHFSQELVPPKSIPVPYTQPQGMAQQGRLRHIILQWKERGREGGERERGRGGGREREGERGREGGGLVSRDMSQIRSHTYIEITTEERSAPL